MTDVNFLERGDGERIAFQKTDGIGPGVVWVGGFRSDMEGTKARFLADWAQKRGRACLRFDHFAHGRSSGDFAAATLTRWRDDAVAVFDALTEGKQILVGSSMGGWVSNLLARTRTDRIAGILWLAPAPDFTEDLMWNLLPEPVRQEIWQTGAWMYDGPDGRYPITKALIESGQRHFVLDKPVSWPFPVRILHGMKDAEVPYTRSLRLIETIAGDVQVAFLKNSGHRLSAPSDLKVLERTLDALIEDAL